MTIIADASVCTRTGAAGWAGWIKAGPGAGGYYGGQFKDGHSPLSAEVCALANIFDLAFRRGHVKRHDVVMLQSDCLGALHLIRKVTGAADRPIRDGLRVGLPKKHQGGATARMAAEHIKGLSEERAIILIVRHVKGHSGVADGRSHVNRVCDASAKAAMRAKRKTLLETKTCPDLPPTQTTTP